MAGITNGAELVARLRESGTGTDKLDVAVKVLNDTHGRATAGDVVAALAERFGERHGTVDKARQFAETGEFIPGRKRPAPPPEAKFLPAPGPQATAPTNPPPVPPVVPPTTDTGAPAGKPGVTEVRDGPPDLEKLTVPELRQYAQQHEINLQGATLKAEIMAAIQKATAEKAKDQPGTE